MAGDEIPKVYNHPEALFLHNICSGVGGHSASSFEVFNHRGNGLLNELRVARFSAAALPFPGNESADVR
jgi:hypothetical protein